MPRQNRVDPYGRIVAHPARGMLMGNRGCLHDDAGRIIKSSDRQAWITCLPTWPGIRRKLMSPGHYTELFFLDEATAMAAGHRPCGSCRPAALAAFKQAWAMAHNLPRPPRAPEIDNALRGGASGQEAEVATLPDGAMFETGQVLGLVSRGSVWRWSFEGYRPMYDPVGHVRVLTPPLMLAVLRAGYSPVLHMSINAAILS